MIAPGASPRDIQWEFSGLNRLEIDKNGSLILMIPGGKVLLEAPVCYQWDDGRRQPVEGRYALTGKKSAGFEVGPYRHDRPLILDPVLVYSTYLGGSLEDAGQGIAVDSGGNAYVTGYTASANFPVSDNFQGAAMIISGATYNAFVSKLNPAGNGLVYSTYLGGSAYDIVRKRNRRGWGRKRLRGQEKPIPPVTSPPTAGAFEPTLGLGAGVFGTTGERLRRQAEPRGKRSMVYSTYLGGGPARTEDTVSPCGRRGRCLCHGKQRQFQPIFQPPRRFRRAWPRPGGTTTRSFPN